MSLISFLLGFVSASVLLIVLALFAIQNDYEDDHQ